MTISKKFVLPIACMMAYGFGLCAMEVEVVASSDAAMTSGAHKREREEASSVATQGVEASMQTDGVRMTPLKRRVMEIIATTQSLHAKSHMIFEVSNYIDEENALTATTVARHKMNDFVSAGKELTQAGKNICLAAYMLAKEKLGYVEPAATQPVIDRDERVRRCFELEIAIRITKVRKKLFDADLSLEQMNELLGILQKNA